MRRFGASNARRCARPGEVIAPMVIATTRSAIPKRHQAYVALVYRVAGGIFLVLWAGGRLPWQFALPAGIGDVTTGIVAVVVAALLAQNGTPPRCRPYCSVC